MNNKCTKLIELSSYINRQKNICKYTIIMKLSSYINRYSRNQYSKFIELSSYINKINLVHLLLKEKNTKINI